MMRGEGTSRNGLSTAAGPANDRNGSGASEVTAGSAQPYRSHPGDRGYPEDDFGSRRGKKRRNRNRQRSRSGDDSREVQR